MAITHAHEYTDVLSIAISVHAVQRSNMSENTSSLLAMMLTAAEEARAANAEADAEVENVKDREKASEQKRPEAMDALVEARKRLAAEETEVRTNRKMIAVSKEKEKASAAKAEAEAELETAKEAAFLEELDEGFAQQGN